MEPARAEQRMFRGIRQEGTMRQRAVWMMAMAVATGVLSGCRTESTKGAGGDQVKLSTPSLGLQIRTNQEAVGSGSGVPVYPGATLVPKESGKGNNDSADINLSFGSMQLRIEVLRYQTVDSADKVRGFYQKELGRYGTVIACVDDRPVGSPTRTQEGLTCDDGKNEKIKGAIRSTSSSSMALKAGSPQHQHAVSIEKDGSGTEFALIRVDLPKEFVIGDDHEDATETTQ